LVSRFGLSERKTMPIIYPVLLPAQCLCGGKPRAEKFLGSGYWRVKCPNCALHGAARSEEEAIIAWNEAIRKIRWQNSTVKGCCQKAENLEEYPQPRTDLEVKFCKVCGCRHFRMLAEPGRLGAIMGGT
jgi:hypothetical protein